MCANDNVWPNNTTVAHHTTAHLIGSLRVIMSSSVSPCVKMICICIVLLSLSCPPPQIFVGNAFGALSPISASANGKCQTLEMSESDGGINCSAIYALCTE